MFSKSGRSSIFVKGKGEVACVSTYFYSKEISYHISTILDSA